MEIYIEGIYVVKLFRVISPFFDQEIMCKYLDIKLLWYDGILKYY